MTRAGRPAPVRGTAPAPCPSLVGYARIPVGGPRHDLDAQAAAIRRGARGQRWGLREILSEEASGADLAHPLLADALARIGSGEFDGLAVARLDRLVCSLGRFGELLQAARRDGWVLVVVDVKVDLSSSAGRLAAEAFATAAEVERKLVSTQTTEALAARRTAGVRLGRPRACSDAVLRQVVSARVRGTGLGQIAADLNHRGVPTPGGAARWYASHVSRLLGTQDAVRLLRDVEAGAGVR